jgi:acetyl esterase/lipase
LLPGLAAALLVLLAAGCTGQQMLNAVTPNSGFKLSPDRVYDDATGLRLDVYQPDPDVSNAPVIVFFFGQGWVEGDKKDYKFVGQALAARGIVAVIPDYRLYPQVRFPDFLLDCARAVRWTHEHIAAYGGDPGKLVLMGHAAGAYNAAMLALAPDYLHQVGADRAWIRGMIGLAGPYDFLPITDPTLRDLFGPPESFERTQPILNVDGHNPPLLLMHGEKDENIPVKNTVNLYDRVTHAGGYAQRVLYPKLNNRQIIEDIATRTQGYADVMNQVEDFTKKVVTGMPVAPPPAIETSVPN